MTKSQYDAAIAANATAYRKAVAARDAAQADVRRLLADKEALSRARHESLAKELEGVRRDNG